MNDITSTIQGQINDYTASNDEEFAIVQSMEALLTAVRDALQVADNPDIITRDAKGGKTFYVEAHRIRSAIESALK